MKLVVPHTTPSLNKTMRMHWTTYRALVSGWQSLLLVCMVQQWGKRRYVKGKVKAVFTLRRKRLMDDDNARGGLKPVIDAMKKMGLLVDDSPQWFEHEVHQEKSSEEETVIELEVVEGGGR